MALIKCRECGKEISKNSFKCLKCENQTRPKVIPNKISREELKKKIRTMSFTEIGKEYNVTDNAIRK